MHRCIHEALSGYNLMLLDVVTNRNVTSKMMRRENSWQNTRREVLCFNWAKLKPLKVHKGKDSRGKVKVPLFVELKELFRV